jgi:maltose/moltooligosaccharide transporter
MRQLAWVQLFIWGGPFCMRTYFSPAVARSVFGATDAVSRLYRDGTAWASVCFSVYNGVALAKAFGLIALTRRVSPKTIHFVGLLCGASGLLSVLVIRDKQVLFASMVGVGIAWACILAMPYAMLADCLPESQMGTYMGVFNFFIVIPQVVIALGSGPLVEHLSGDAPTMRSRSAARSWASPRCWSSGWITTRAPRPPGREGQPGGQSPRRSATSSANTS